MKRQILLLLGAMSVALVMASGISVATDLKELTTSWGHNGDGQLGTGNNVFFSNKAVWVEDISSTQVKALDAGFSHNLALKTDGTVWAWGLNEDGQLGNKTSGTDNKSYVPERVSGLSGVKAISAGNAHSLALKTDGTVWAWGDNFYGQLGDGTSGTDTDSNVPVQVKDPTDPSTFLQGVTAISAGDAFNLALKKDGTVRAWGVNEYGQLGNGTSGTGADSEVPVRVSGLTSVRAISAGGAHSLALRSNGGVRAWGGNFYGQLGNGTDGEGTDSNVPVQVSGLKTDVTAISAGAGHNLALKDTGGVRAWGYNNVGQLGDGTNTHSNVPVQVSGLKTGVTGVSAGFYHSLALRSNGGVRAWGSNYQGQLGDETFTEFHSPIAVPKVSGVTAISAGQFHSLAK